MTHYRSATLALILWAFAALGFEASGALEWQSGKGYRSATLPVPLQGKTGFSEMSQTRTGIRFTNVLSSSRSLTNQIYLNGSGVALGDVDGDGLCDIFLCGLERGNALYRNLGDWKFEDITDRAGVACLDQASTGAAFADIDGDGDLDLLVSSIGRGVRLFLNDGQGRFHEVTELAGLGGKTGSTSLALADIDGDGTLDIYVANYRTHTLRDEPDTRFRVSTLNGEFRLLAVNGTSVTAPELAGRFTVDPVNGVLENGEPDVLYKNDGHGKFSPLSWTDGTFLDEAGQPIHTPYDWGLSVMFRDLNGDRAPDIYVCNDFHSEDRIWLNDGHGRFRALPSLGLRHTSLFSMGVDFADIDRDGRDEIFVADMLSRSHARRQVQIADRKMLPPAIGLFTDRPQYSRNMLFWNRGDQTYAEIAQLSGVEASDWTWCPVFLDVDLDGFEDLLLVTGHERDAQNADVARQIATLIKQQPMSRTAQLHLRQRFPVYDTPSFAFHNRGDLTFEEAGHAWGFDARRVSQGIALADLDNDGDLDVVINCLNSAPLIYRNDTIAPRVAVRLRGRAPNTQGIGSKIRVLGNFLPQQSQEVICGGRYLSADDPLRVFAAGNLTNSLRIEVDWRDGRHSVVSAAQPNRVYELVESDEPEHERTNNLARADRRAATGQSSADGSMRPQGVQNPMDDNARSRPWFEDQSAALKHMHQENNFDDYARQPLLPRRFSQNGPGITWFDADGDGWEDLIIGTGKGGHTSFFRNNRQGAFVLALSRALTRNLTRDQTTILGWNREPGRAFLIAGSSNYEDGLPDGPVAHLFDLREDAILDELPGQPSSTGPLALADFDGDGDLDLFVGGQVVPGRYPQAASSLLFRNEAGTFHRDERASKAFENLGLVNGAIWSDLDGDGLPELLLACEWGPIRVFQFIDGQIQEITERLGLSTFTGWWQSVAVGDFDGDGKMDIVAGNWGRNTKYQSFLSAPLRLYSGDFNGDGTVQLVEAYFDPELKKVVPWKDWQSLGHSIPFLLDRYQSFAQFSTAGAVEILGRNSDAMREVSATTLDSMVFLNRGGRFEAHSLPLEAQLAPVFGLAVADFDGDGHEDLFLSQNYFAVPADTSRYDAGRGALLQGNGHGSFTPIPAQESGIAVYGEGRGAAVCDYDHDGRPDFAVGQNANATKLYRNVRGKPGLRVQFNGPPGNQAGIGAVLRLEDQNGRLGPSREVHAGGGYWSQDASDQVLSLADQPSWLRVTWPGGRVTRVPVPNGTKQLSLSYPTRDP